MVKEIATCVHGHVKDSALVSSPQYLEGTLNSHPFLWGMILVLSRYGISSFAVILCPEEPGRTTPGLVDGISNSVTQSSAVTSAWQGLVTDRKIVLGGNELEAIS